MNKSNENFLIIQNAIDMSRDEAFEILAADDDTLKPYALINIDEILSQDEADLIIFHLTNHSNPTREACALRLCDICDARFLKGEKILNTLEDAICDINPNICRSIIELLSKNPDIAELIMPLNLKRINDLLDDFKIYEKECGTFSTNKTKNRKNHAKNKKLFNLYWCLEALGETISTDCAKDEEILKIVYQGADFLDYTIREKSAKILSKISFAPKELLQKLKNDENFYVKNQVCDKIC